MVTPRATRFIAEVSSNHNRDLARCLKFIDTAKDIGCDAVKFQLFKIDQLFAPEILAKSEEHRKRRDWELPVEFLPELASRCRELNIDFSCTPFYLDAIAELEPFVRFYKIASYELLWDKLIEACAKTKKPLIMSTGMATLEEVAHAVGVARKNGCVDLTLLHCVSGYPTPLNECNLAAIETLRTRFQCNVGWSDHSVSEAVIYRAVDRWGATDIEFHLDLDAEGAEFETGHCWLPEKIKRAIHQTRTLRLADGGGVKIPVKSEVSDRLWRADPVDGLRPLLTERKRW